MSVSAVRAHARSPHRALAARAGLALIAAGNAELGIWGLVAPHSLYRNYPGAGRHWISALGPYNEHLVRDFAAAELGFAVLLIAAAIWFGPRLVLAAGVAFLTATIPHVAYHLTTTGSFSTADNVASLGAFALEIVLVVLAIVTAQKGVPDDPPTAI
jgi:hypothetical protein